MQIAFDHSMAYDMHSYFNGIQSLFGFLSRLQYPFIILLLVQDIQHSSKPSQGGDSAEHAEVIGAKLLKAELDCRFSQIELCTKIIYYHVLSININNRSEYHSQPDVGNHLDSDFPMQIEL